MTHYHQCPKCYQKESCQDDCTLDSNLNEDSEEWFGSHCLCSECRESNSSETSNDSEDMDVISRAEWFANYNGFRRRKR